MRYDKALAITERHGKLLKLLRKNSFSAPALAKKLGVSDQTIYRDIESLRRRGCQIESRRDADHWAYLLVSDRRLGMGA